MSENHIIEGKVQFSIPSIDYPCYTYYKIFGELQSGTPPLVVLHGGPGTGHQYCLPFSNLWSLYSIPVVLYDQIGCASSTRLPHTEGDRSLWRVDLFVAELENLLEALNISHSAGPGFHILGHSWRGIVAAKFASRRPPRLRRLVLMGASSDGQLFFENLWQLTKQLSTEAQLAIHQAVQNREFTDPAYRAAFSEFSRMFLCRADPWPPEELTWTFKYQAEDGTVRRTLQGPSPWVYDGVLRTYSSIPILPQISAPTLVVNGEFDTTQDGPTAPFFEHIPRVRWITLPGASHMPFLDSAAMLEKTLVLVVRFLQQPEASAQG